MEREFVKKPIEDVRPGDCVTFEDGSSDHWPQWIAPAPDKDNEIGVLTWYHDGGVGWLYYKAGTVVRVNDHANPFDRQGGALIKKCAVAKTEREAVMYAKRWQRGE